MALVSATAAGAQTTAPNPPVTPPPSQPAAGAKATPKKDDGKKKDELGKIEGMTIPRGSTFLGLQIVNGTFKLTFYNSKKKPVPPDVTRANLRWNVRTESLPERTVLNPGGDPNSLTSSKIVKPPYSFSLTIILVKGEGDNAPTEIFTVDFHQ